MTPEERKDARAHRSMSPSSLNRNPALTVSSDRIAAQNSRDKRKAQFGALERRVAELEEENKQLRAGLTLSAFQRTDIRHNSEEQEREKAPERENAELKERIKTLEKGWEAVVKVLVAQGLPAPSTTTATALPSPPSSNPSSSSTSPSTSNTTATFPVLVPSNPVLPLTPSPTISTASLFQEAEADADEPEPESTLYPARMESVAAIPPATPLQRVDPASRLLTLHKLLCLPPRRRLPLLPSSQTARRHLLLAVRYPHCHRPMAARTTLRWRPGSERSSRAHLSSRLRLRACPKSPPSCSLTPRPLPWGRRRR